MSAAALSAAAAAGSRQPRAEYSFYLSCDVDLQVQLRVDGLYGALPALRGSAGSSGGGGGDGDGPAVPRAAAFVVARLMAGGEELGLEAKTAYAEAGPSGAAWREPLTLCLKVRDLPSDAHLVLGLWQVSEASGASLVGSAAMPLFSKKGRLKTGPKQLLVRERADVALRGCGGGSGSGARVAAAAAAAADQAAEQAEQQQQKDNIVFVPVTALAAKVRAGARSEAGQLAHLASLYARGDMPRCGWLDALTSREVARVRGAELAAAAAAGELRLAIELPAYPNDVLYQHPPSLAAIVAGGGGAGGAGGGGGGGGGGVRDDSGMLAGGGPFGSVATGGGSGMASLGDGSSGNGGPPPDDDAFERIVVLADTEVGRENPAELKAAKLARSQTRGLVDRDAKPSAEERRAIAAVLKLPPNRPLSGEERALLWRYRYTLRDDKRALTKFLKAVDWRDVYEATQAAELMSEWAPIGVADALELLSPDFKNDAVRAHAVAVLQQKDDEELTYYLLQLVQALRFEAVDMSRLARFLVARAAANPAFATHLHWYLFTEWDDPAFGPRASAVHAALVDGLTAAPAGAAVWEAIRRQTDMVSQLAYIVKDLKMSRLKAARATERLREMLSASGPCEELTTSRVPLPLNPHMLLEGLVPAECLCFRSAQLPVKLAYRVAPRPIDWSSVRPLSPEPLAKPEVGSSGSGLASGEAAAAAASPSIPATPPVAPVPEAPHLPPSCRTALAPSELEPGALRCVLIYKKGDDLRQDQFVLQMLSLMDRLLKRENLDLCLTPYRVLPTGSDDGLVEFVPSLPLSHILAEHRSIHRFLLACGQSDPSGPFGVQPEALETFVRSCAGYCVMTHILGVGDRHLDNLMLAPDGRLFHIDFGYILGNDPKPFPPPMKLCREMVEAMGGADSPLYVRFRMLACEAYNILRKNADLILSLLHLMAGASIEAIRSNPENAMLKIQEKLRLDFDDGQAVEWMQALINESATAMMPQIMERTHRWAQYWR